MRTGILPLIALTFVMLASCSCGIAQDFARATSPPTLVSNFTPFFRVGIGFYAGLGGAGVDVLSVEPPRDGNPLLALDLPNLIVTPHIAWSSRQAQEMLADEVIKNIEAFAAGTPRNLLS